MRRGALPARAARLAVALCLGVLLSACSAVKIVYNNAYDIAAWMIDDYLDLNL